MGHGGKRYPVGGRPKGSKGKKTLAREDLKAYFLARARQEFDAVFAEYVKRAKGEPSDADPRIQIDFLNRLLGKPPESVELSGAAGEALTVRIVHREVRE